MNSIIRGTNATIKLTLGEDVDFTAITSLELYLVQAGNTIVKTLNQLTLDPTNRSVSYKLSQEESLSLKPDIVAKIFLIGIVNGDRIETRPIVEVRVESTYKNEVMV